MSLILLCLVFAGCATIGQVGSAFFNGFTGLLGGMFKVLHWMADILNKIPTPPGVF